MITLAHERHLSRGWQMDRAMQLDRPALMLSRRRCRRILTKLSHYTCRSYFREDVCFDWGRWMSAAVVRRSVEPNSIHYQQRTSPADTRFWWTALSKHYFAACNSCPACISAYWSSLNDVHLLLAKTTHCNLSLIHIWRCRRSTLCRSRWSPYH